MNEHEGDPKDFWELLRQHIESEGGIDAAALAKAAGLSDDPALIAKLMSQMQDALKHSAANTTGGVNWKLAEEQARAQARNGAFSISDVQRQLVESATNVGTLWLDAHTTLPSVNTEPKLLTREVWVADAIGIFQQLTKPVAERMASALTETMRSAIPEEMAEMNRQAGEFMRSAGGAMFAMQLGQALGKLSGEVLSGGDISIPVFRDRAALIPQNIDAFVKGFEMPIDQAYIYLVVRELAYARLFKNAKWLRDAIVTQISQFAAEIHVDAEHLRTLAEELDLNNPDELRSALESGAMIAPRTAEQERAVAAIETLLATLDGWVQVVTEQATTMLPSAPLISEAVLRRRAEGGPAELTFGTLIGLQLRPRRLREAVEMWRKVGFELGNEVRDSLWSHPDQLPTSDEIDIPELLIQRLTGGDDMDRALRDLLGD